MPGYASTWLVERPGLAHPSPEDVCLGCHFWQTDAVLSSCMDAGANTHLYLLGVYFGLGWLGHKAGVRLTYFLS